jgi:hypothetical protein
VPYTRATLNDAADHFLNDVAEVAGYGTGRLSTKGYISSYVVRRPILTVPDPWFYAGLVALESTKICHLFTPRDAAILLRRISAEVDGAIGRRGGALARLVFALMGRLGYGAVLLRMRVSDDRISDMILLMMGNEKTWHHLLPDAEALYQVRRALRTGPPTWWIDFYLSRAGREQPPAEEDTLDLSSVPALMRLPEHLDERTPST